MSEVLVSQRKTDREGSGQPAANGHYAHLSHSEAGKAVSEAVYWRDYYEHPTFT